MFFNMSNSTHTYMIYREYSRLFYHLDRKNIVMQIVFAFRMVRFLAHRSPIILNGCDNVRIRWMFLRVTQHGLIDHLIASSGENNSPSIQSGITPFYHLNLSHPRQPYPLLCDAGFYVSEVSFCFVARLIILRKGEGRFSRTRIVHRALLSNNCIKGNKAL